MRIAATSLAVLCPTTLALGLSLALQDPAVPLEPTPTKTFEVFRAKELLAERAESKRAYLPFLKRSTLHCGIDHLAKGALDGQSPHDQDEVDCVLAGQGRFTCGQRMVEVAEGDVLFVAALEEHRFHDVTEDLELLVCFSTAPPKPAEAEQRK
jgi:mannose-6-phosphate isomerase-like protein (cupin superfamily)